MPAVPLGERVLYKEIREGKQRQDKFESEDREGILVWALQKHPTSNLLAIATELLERSLSGGE